jgi:hypothetical protein
MEHLLEPAYPFDSITSQEAARRSDGFLLQQANQKLRRAQQAIDRTRGCYHDVALGIVSVSCPAVPPLYRTADHGCSGLGFKDRELALELGGEPYVVRIQEGDVLASRVPDTKIP